MAEKPTREVQKLRTISWLFDELIRIPGTNIRLGADALLGLLPGGGDLIGGAVSSYAILVAARLGAPPAVIARMALNIGIDALIGVIPVLGDVFDVGWKANRRNANLLEEYMRVPAKAKRSSMMVVVVAFIALAAMLLGMAWLSVWVLRQIF
jgi:hypothetical protein